MLNLLTAVAERTTAARVAAAGVGTTQIRGVVRRSLIQIVLVMEELKKGAVNKSEIRLRSLSFLSIQQTSKCS